MKLHPKCCCRFLVCPHLFFCISYFHILKYVHCIPGGLACQGVSGGWSCVTAQWVWDVWCVTFRVPSCLSLGDEVSWIPWLVLKSSFCFSDWSINQTLGPNLDLSNVHCGTDDRATNRSREVWTYKSTQWKILVRNDWKKNLEVLPTCLPIGQLDQADLHPQW